MVLITSAYLTVNLSNDEQPLELCSLQVTISDCDKLQ